MVIFRGYQYIRLQYLKKINYWAWLSKKLDLFYCNHKCCDFLAVVINPNAIYLNELQKQKLKKDAIEVITSHFTIFDQQVPNLETCDFSTDWRYGKKWPNQYYKKYVFYEKKNIPYDVKFPWELSRFHYLVPVLAWQWASQCDHNMLDQIFSLLTRWRKDNPLAHSVNWYPMEASMRAINLVVMLDFVRLLWKREWEYSAILKKIAQQLQIMIFEHGRFIWENREFTDVRGNHFTANLVALLLAANALGKTETEQERWQTYAVKWLDKEVQLQFCSDGVNFEKSCGYHKLVLELFLLAAIARERIGMPFSQEAKTPLANAACYSDAITRPDGLAANFGDTDDAILLPFNLDRPRSHGQAVELARAFFEDDLGTFVFEDSDRLAPLFLLGQTRPRQPVPKKIERITFTAGGYVVVRHQTTGFFFMVDVGEVGMAGRGGHGHNDLLSFELCINGQSIVVDSGCSGYTADLKKKTLYRSTTSHATVCLFDEEIARFSGHWRICDDAHPLDVEVTVDEGKIIIRAGHDGYDRIDKGMRIWRRFEILPQDQMVDVIDEIYVTCDEALASWAFPIGYLEAVSVDPSKIKLGKDRNVTVDSEQSLSFANSLFSSGYGHEIIGRTLVARALLPKGIHSRRFSFYKDRG